MPYIPLLKRNTELAMPQEPAPIREASSEVNANGVLRAMQDLGDASMRQPVDERPFVAAAGAKGAVLGKALIGVGDVLSALAVKRQEDIEKRTMNEFRLAAGNAESELAAFKESHADNPESWVTQGLRIFERLTKPLLARRGLRRGTRENLQVMAASAGRRMEVTTQADVDRANFRKTKQTYSQLGQQSYGTGLLAEGDGHIDAGHAGGYFSDAERDELKAEGARTVRARAHAGAMQGYELAVASGSEEKMRAAVSLGMAEAGWSQEDADGLIQNGTARIAQVVELKRTQAEAEVVRELTYRSAGGEEFLPSQIMGLVESGKLRMETAAPYLKRAVEQKRPLRGEWAEFIEEASLYRPGDDRNFEKETGLHRRARELNPDEAGMAQFLNVMNNAKAENGDAQKWTNRQLRVNASKQLRKTFRHPQLRQVWDEDLEAALPDTAKLQQFGLSAPQAAEIRAYMGFDRNGKPGDVQTYQKDGVAVTVSKNPARAFQLFQEATRVAHNDQATAEKLGMGRWAWELFNEARTAREDGSIPRSAAEKAEGASRARLADEQLQVWYDSETNKANGVPPDAKRVNEKVAELSRDWMQSSALRSLVGTSAAAETLTP